MVLVHGNETLRDGNDTEILIFKFFPGLKKNRTQTENLKNRICLNFFNILKINFLKSKIIILNKNENEVI